MLVAEGKKKLSLYEKMKIQVELDKAKEGKESVVFDEEKKRKGPRDLLPPLRNFKEGRYEDVLMEFEKKTARKEGVIVDEPSKKTIRKKQRKKMRKQAKHAEKKKERHTQHHH